MNKTVAEVLAELPKNQKIYYRANPGNAGDALIATGTFQLFDRLGIDFEIVDIDNFDPNNKVVVYAGGGNFNHIYSDARKFIENVHSNVQKFILLPHTITDNEDLIAALGDNCVIFAREVVSFEHTTKHAKQCSVFLDHDMALHIDLRQVLEKQYPNTKSLIIKKLYRKLRRDGRDHIPSIRQLSKADRFEKASLKNRSRRVGKFFRSDVEASGTGIPVDNADLSVIFEFGTRNREYCDYTVWRLLRYISKFDEIQTDRLHICIAAAMLNKTVSFYSNSYFKCKAVFEYSLESKYPTIHWNG